MAADSGVEREALYGGAGIAQLGAYHLLNRFGRLGIVGVDDADFPEALRVLYNSVVK